MLKCKLVQGTGGSLSGSQRGGGRGAGMEGSWRGARRGFSKQEGKDLTGWTLLFWNFGAVHSAHHHTAIFCRLLLIVTSLSTFLFLPPNPRVLQIATAGLPTASRRLSNHTTLTYPRVPLTTLTTIIAFSLLVRSRRLPGSHRTHRTENVAKQFWKQTRIPKYLGRPQTKGELSGFLAILEGQSTQNQGPMMQKARVQRCQSPDRLPSSYAFLPYQSPEIPSTPRCAPLIWSLMPARQGGSLVINTDTAASPAATLIPFPPLSNHTTRSSLLRSILFGALPNRTLSNSDLANESGKSTQGARRGRTLERSTPPPPPTCITSRL